MIQTKTALITGGGSGLGYEFAKLFARDGYDLVLVGRDKERLSKASEELKKNYGVKIILISKDLSLPDSSQKIYNQLQKEKIEIDVLVNNAGFTVHGFFYQSKLEEIESEINTNITSLTQLTHFFLPQMVNRKEGKILNIASIAAFQPGPLMAVYYASKSYVLSFSEAISEELKGTGVTVTALCPGAMETGFAKRAGIQSMKNFQNHPTNPTVIAKQGYQGLMNKKRVVIPGFKNNAILISSRFIPHYILMRFIKNMHELKKLG